MDNAETSPKALFARAISSHSYDLMSEKADPPTRTVGSGHFSKFLNACRFRAIGRNGDEPSLDLTRVKTAAKALTCRNLLDAAILPDAVAFQTVGVAWRQHYF